MKLVCVLTFILVIHGVAILKAAKQPEPKRNAWDKITLPKSAMASLRLCAHLNPKILL